MNIVTLSTVSDFQTALATVFSRFQISVDGANDTVWCIALEDDFAHKVDVKSLRVFFEEYVEYLKSYERSQDIIFYAWFDQQALQLRFNVIAGCSLSALPFECQTTWVENIDTIIQDFIATARTVLGGNDPVEVENFDWDDEDEHVEYALNVFCEIIPKQNANKV